MERPHHRDPPRSRHARQPYTVTAETPIVNTCTLQVPNARGDEAYDRHKCVPKTQSHTVMVTPKLQSGNW